MPCMSSPSLFSYVLITLTGDLVTILKWGGANRLSTAHSLSRGHFQIRSFFFRKGKLNFSILAKNSKRLGTFPRVCFFPFPCSYLSRIFFLPRAITLPAKAMHYRNEAWCRWPPATPTAICRGRRRSFQAGQPVEVAVGTPLPSV